jgi:flagellar biosynthesis/type III secretory pathway protein FliH
MSATPAMASQARPDPRRDDRGIVRPDQRNDRGYRDDWDRRATPRFDLAFRNGEEDGYREGLRDGERGDRFDPVRESRYRSGDHGYERRYGPKELYKNRYRDAFRRGYEQGYQDGRRHGRRNSRGPSWWPFGR